MKLDPADAAAQSGAAADETVLDTSAADAQAAASSEPSQEATTETDAAAQAPAAEPFDVRDFIAKGLDAIENGEDLPGTEKPADEEEPKAETEPPAEEEEKPEAEEKPQEPEKPEEPKAEGESKTDEEEKPAEESEPARPALMTREEIDAKYPRTPNELRQLAANYAEEVNKTIEAYGGEHFEKPVKMIVEGLQSEDNIPIIGGILEAQGTEGFLGLMYDVMKVTLVDAQKDDTQATTPEAKHFTEATRKLADSIFEETFGEGANLALVSKLVKYHREDLLNTKDVDDYYAQEGKGEIKESDSPEVVALKTRVAELEAKTAAKPGEEEPGADTAGSAPDADSLSAGWEKDTQTAVETRINERLLSRSNLKDLPTDTQEVKDAKAAFRKALTTEAASYRQSKGENAKLRDAALRGSSATANYKKQFDALVDGAYNEAKKLAEPFEALLNVYYKSSRNGRVAGQGNEPHIPAPGEKTDQDPQPLKEPTQTLQKPAEVDLDKWRENLVTQLAEMEQSASAAR
jgi:hypothetical protein